METLKKLMVGVAIVALLGLAAVAYAHPGANAMGQGMWFGHMMGPNQMMGSNHMMGPGQMMGSGHMMMNRGMHGGSGHMMGSYGNHGHNGMGHEPGWCLGQQNGAPDNAE